MSWSVWLTSSDTYIVPDNDSLIPLSSLGTLSVVKSPEWLEVPVKALDAGYEPWVDNSLAQARLFNLQTRPFIFPDEIAIVDSIYEVFRKRFIYLCIDGAEQDESAKYPYRIHPNGSCISIVANDLTDMNHNHDDGIKEISVQLRKTRALI